MKILYRISNGGYKKEKLPFADKFYCLENFLKIFGKDDVHIFADNCLPETINKLKTYNLKLTESNKGSSGQSWKMVAEYAIKHFSDQETIYFLEDDYLHRNNAFKLIEEGLHVADYVSLYDHPDKYIDGSKGGNRFVKDGGEFSKIIKTESSHWKTTTSTTMTFACKLKTLKEDWGVWDEFTKGTLPNDDQIFYKLMGIRKFKFIISAVLRGKKRKLITPIPGFSTHVESAWLSPFVDWENA